MIDSIFERIYIFDVTGLQACLMLRSKPKVTFILDDITTLKGMLISAKLLKLSSSIDEREFFMANGKLAIYVDKYMIIGILHKFSEKKLHEMREALRYLHRFIEERAPQDVDSFINTLINFIIKYRNLYKMKIVSS